MQDSSSLDRSFTVLILVLSIFLIPMMFQMFDVSDKIQDGSLLRGYLLSSLTVVALVIVTVYGLAVLFDIQWLRLAGLYGLFCIYLKTWLFVCTFLSRAQENWGSISDLTWNYTINGSSLALAVATFYGWQWRKKAKAVRLTYCLGVLTSYDLFLVFSFLLSYVLFDYSGTMHVALVGIIFLFLSGVLTVSYLMVKKLSMSRVISYPLLILWILAQTEATLLLLQPVLFRTGWNTGWLLLFLGGIALVMSMILAGGAFHCSFEGRSGRDPDSCKIA